MDVLIADDSSVVRKIIQDVCNGRSWKIEIHHAEDGDRARDILARMDNGLAFLDINMPGMTGLEALAHARRAGKKIMSVIMSSADGHPLRTAAQELGAYDYLVKPFNAQRIQAVLESARSILSSHSVLIVDDSATVRKILTRMMYQLPGAYEVEEAQDAETAIRMMRAGLFDTVLLDLTMPGLDGLAALPMLKAENPDARIFIVTSHNDRDTVVACQAAGADGFLVKPVHPENLRKLMELNGGRLSA
ncbi:MAG: response regulator [Alphaproteobacteria bacterium]|nr:response regulator [Alphaproteobacteria bacterium]